MVTPPYARRAASTTGSTPHSEDDVRACVAAFVAARAEVLGS
ncbi:hypothetical protein [Janibacter indicus]|nr:hypothetical protein [Janibacter indicus]